MLVFPDVSAVDVPDLDLRKNRFATANSDIFYSSLAALTPGVTVPPQFSFQRPFSMYLVWDVAIIFLGRSVIKGEKVTQGARDTS